MKDLSMIYVTASCKEEAVKIGSELVRKRLAACANVIEGVRSIYRWDGRICDEPEVALILKTKTSLFPELERDVRSMHSYECPCIVSIPLSDVSGDYADWIIRETA